MHRIPRLVAPQNLVEPILHLDPLASRTCLHIRARDEIQQALRWPRKLGKVRPYATFIRLNGSARMMSNQTNDGLVEALSSEKAGTIHRMKPSLRDPCRIPNVMRPRGRHDRHRFRVR